jgi:hypothetical protein
MPPHCDSLDGPIVIAARQALEAGNVDLALPFVPEDTETEVRAIFDTVLPVRDLSVEARAVADRLFSRPWYASTVPVRAPRIPASNQPGGRRDR